MTNSKKILIVDDSKTICMKLQKILESHDFSVVGCAHSGEEALTRYGELKPDLVTMDLILPGIDGIEATRKILEQDPKAKVVVVSSVGSFPQKITEALEAGARNIISKPFEEDKVVSVLDKVLQGM